MRASPLERLGNLVNWLSVPAFIVWLWLAGFGGNQ